MNEGSELWVVWRRVGSRRPGEPLTALLRFQGWLLASANTSSRPMSPELGQARGQLSLPGGEVAGLCSSHAVLNRRLPRRASMLELLLAVVLEPATSYYSPRHHRSCRPTCGCLLGLLLDEECAHLFVISWAPWCFPCVGKQTP